MTLRIRVNLHTPQLIPKGHVTKVMNIKILTIPLFTFSNAICVRFYWHNFLFAFCFIIYYYYYYWCDIMIYYYISWNMGL